MSLTDDERRRIEDEARKLVIHLDRAPMDVLCTHISIHGHIIRALAKRTGKNTRRIRSMSCMSAVEALYPQRVHRDLREALHLLNQARNIVAHEEFTGEMFIKVGELGRLVRGRTYDESPQSVSAARAQFLEILRFVHAWVTCS